MGPRTLEEARRMEAETRNLKASHEFYCDTCIHFKRCVGSPKLCIHLGHNSDMQPCEVAATYDRIIAAAAVLVETAKVVDGNGPQD